jgi:serralysin
VITAFRDGPSLASALALQADGKIVAVGSLEVRGTFFRNLALARYRPSGRLDRTFGGDGKRRINFVDSRSEVGAVLQDNEKIVVAGGVGGLDTEFFAIARLKPSGRLDPTFGGDGKVSTSFASRGAYASAVAVQPDGRIVAAGINFPGNCGGDDSEFALARYRRAGALDRSFGGDGRVTTEIGGDCVEDTFISGLALQDDGKILVAGAGNPNAEDHTSFVLARYNADGTLDPAFGGGDGIVGTPFGGRPALAFDVALQSDGGVVAVGRAGKRRFALARYTANGTLDSTFGGDGKVTTQFDQAAGAEALAIDADGRILVAGTANGSFALGRYNPDGSLDLTFGGDGIALTFRDEAFSSAFDLAIDQNERVVAAGVAKRKFALVRYHP